MFRTLLTAASLAIAMATISHAQTGDHRLQRTIALSGHGEVRVVPDSAVVTIGVLSHADTAVAALAANTSAMQAVLATLKSANIAGNDVQTSNFTVQPRYDYANDQPPRLAGYEVLNNVTATVRKIQSLGAILDKVVSAGSNQINGIEFQVSRPESALDEARRLAVADATHKAKIYAFASTTTLGNVLSISEGINVQPPIVARAKMLGAEQASDVPVAEGQQTISVDVNMIWEIK